MEANQSPLRLMGALAGDVIGSRFEWHSTKRTDFPLFVPECRFTDDTVLTAAVADAILNGEEYGAAILRWAKRYPEAGYGGSFKRWLASPHPQPYHSFGNGSAMRVSPVGWAFDREETVLSEAERSAAPTHNHPEGIRGAQAVALAIFLARQGAGKEDIRSEISRQFGYDLSRTLDQIRPAYRFDVTCQGSVPEAILAFLESHDLESAIRLAISLGGDADTQAAIAGSIAEAYYGDAPDEIVEGVRLRLPADLWAVVLRFSQAVGRSG